MSESPASEFESAIYRGFVRHRRFTPKQHEFDYPLFMMLMKADEIPQLLEKFWQLGSKALSWARFKRSDYLDNANQTLSESVREKLAALTGKPRSQLDGDVFILCHLRYLGLYFSPLNLYFLRQGDGYRYMLAEVSNTPWNERHYYCIDLDDPKPHAKAFHVSPFNPLQQQYRWRITPPDARELQCLVHIESWQDLETDSGETAETKIFDATLSLQRVPLNQSELTRVLIRTPVQTASIVAGIYWQALKLYCKGVPFHSHPGRRQLGDGESGKETGKAMSKEGSV